MSAQKKSPIPTIGNGDKLLSNDEKRQIKESFTTLYTEYCPSKIPKINNIMKKYELDLLGALGSAQLKYRGFVGSLNGAQEGGGGQDDENLINGCNSGKGVQSMDDTMVQDDDTNVMQDDVCEDSINGGGNINMNSSLNDSFVIDFIVLNHDDEEEDTTTTTTINNNNNNNNMFEDLTFNNRKQLAGSSSIPNNIDIDKQKRLNENHRKRQKDEDKLSEKTKPTTANPATTTTTVKTAAFKTAAEITFNPVVKTVDEDGLTVG